MKNNNKKQKNKNLKLILLIDLMLVMCIACVIAIGKMHTPAPAEPLALIGDQEVSIELGSEYTDPGVNNARAEVSGEVDTGTAGDYNIVYRLGDQEVVRTVHVIQPGNIVIGLRGSKVQLVRQGDPYIENGAFAINKDKEGGMIVEDQITVEGEVDTSKPGEYEVTYTVPFGSTNYTATRTVRVLSPEEFGDNDYEVSVMMYNSVYTADDVPARLNGNWILDTDLEEQLKYLGERDYYFPGWRELRAWIDGKISLPEKSIAVTFDVGKKETLKYGIPLLEKYKIPATVFMVCWEDNGAAGKVRKYASEYVDFESNSYAMHQAGYDPNYRGIVGEMSQEEIAEDLVKASKIVGNDAYAYPYGEAPGIAYRAVQDQGFQCAFLTDYGRVRQGMDPHLLPRVRVLGDESFEVWRQSAR